MKPVAMHCMNVTTVPTLLKLLIMETNVDDVEMLVVVDREDRDLYYQEKNLCHSIPVALHRAFSIFLVNSAHEMLIQQRHATKKTWPGFWSNACCSHPRKDESLDNAVRRRLLEELGVICNPKPLFRFYYKADYDELYGEHEIDHVFLAVYDGEIRPNNNEVQGYRFMPVDELREDIMRNGSKYTPWFKESFHTVEEYLGHYRSLSDESGAIS